MSNEINRRQYSAVRRVFTVDKLIWIMGILITGTGAWFTLRADVSANTNVSNNNKLEIKEIKEREIESAKTLIKIQTQSESTEKVIMELKQDQKEFKKEHRKDMDEIKELIKNIN